MRKIRNYEVEHTPFDSAAVSFRDRSGKHIVEIDCGGVRNVDVELFREREYTYVLSWNRDFPYVGLEKFLGHEPKGNLFLSSKDAITNTLGERGLNLAPISMAKKLASYLVVIPTPAPASADRQSVTRSFEIHLEDLNEGAKQRYLEAVGGEPALGPLAILEFNKEEEDEKEA